MKKLMGNRLVGNIISLIVLQGSNFLFPLITFPYLVRTLGIENYGVLLFCISIMQFLNILIDYGFNISGTRDISINKDRMDKVNAIYNVILTIKILLALLFGLIYFSIILSIPFFSENRAAFLIIFLMIIGNTFFPLWLYQGLERMKYITYFNVIAKAFVTILVFMFIKSADDLSLAAFFHSLYFILPAIISVLFAKIKLKMDFKIVLDVHKIKDELKRGKHVFMTSLWVNFYSQGPIVILGFISGSRATGIYGIGEKVQGAFYGISQPFTQALYPYLCDLFENEKERFDQFKRKLMWIGISFSILIAISLFIFSAPIAAIVSGTADPKITALIKVFSVIVFLSITNTLMARIMHAVNLSNVLNKNYLIAAIVFIVFSIPLTIWLHQFGMAVAVIFAEGTVFVLNIRNVTGIKATEILPPIQNEVDRQRA
ncbi:flippase [Mesobacillus boroniphilus]|uniref:Flippase n=1 Tax=Mesobacillus boroniphilus TaxID=308892 RepID=A0A944GY46_9BACI|nr:flippase [Mesobacillus boroniphilus]MBS8266572.1 flippase [Mesobacillus boroniphilus]